MNRGAHVMTASRKKAACPGPGRRDLLRAGVLGFLGLGLDDWFRLRATAADRSRPAAPARNCILIWLAGGPSHIDTFDPKPAAPADVRGEFKPIATAVPGLQISEISPTWRRSWTGSP